MPSFVSPGEAQIFRRTGTTWSIEGIFRPMRDDSTSFQALGSAMAIDGRSIVIGSPGSGGNSPASAYVFRLLPTDPAIASMSPLAGHVGDTVTIAGSGFLGASSVRFGGAAAPFTVVDAQTITATVPAAAVTGPIVVTTASGVATSPTDFGVAPDITSFTPPAAAVGKPVTVTGSGFVGTTSVTVGGAAATFTLNNANTITATVPSDAVTGPIVVTTPNGVATSPSALKVKPKVKSFTPVSGPVSTFVTIKGSGFAGVQKVTFNGAQTVFTVINSTKITCLVPAGATTGRIAVKTAGGTGTSKTDFSVT